jgi:hypothetical protein
MPPPVARCSSRASSSLISPGCVSLPRKRRRVGLHIVLFEACSAFTRVAARPFARSPIRDPLPEGFSHFVTSMTAPVASGWSNWPGGALTHWKAPPCHGAPSEQKLRIAFPSYAQALVSPLIARDDLHTDNGHNAGQNQPPRFLSSGQMLCGTSSRQPAGNAARDEDGSQPPVDKAGGDGSAAVVRPSVDTGGSDETLAAIIGISVIAISPGAASNPADTAGSPIGCRPTRRRPSNLGKRCLAERLVNCTFLAPRSPAWARVPTIRMQRAAASEPAAHSRQPQCERRSVRRVRQ